MASGASLPSFVRRRAAWLVVTAWAVGAAVWRAGLHVQWFTLSVDDVFRTQHAIEAAGGAALPSDLWPPLPFWLAGALIRLGVPAWTAPGVVNFVAMVIAFALAVATARVLSARPLVTALLVATLPWNLWLAWSGLSEPIAMAAHVAVVRGLAEWRSRRGVAFVVSGLVIGGLTRYEAWGDLAVVVALAWGVRREVPWRWVALPLLFPALWLPLQAIWFGDPLNFATSAREILLKDPGAPVGIDAVVLASRRVWQATDVGLVLGAIGWWRLRRTAPGPAAFGLSCLLLQVGAALVDLSGSHTTQRHFLTHGLFLAIGAGAALGDLRGGAFAVALVTMLGLRAGLADARMPTFYLDPGLEGVAAGVRRLLDREAGDVMVELDDFPSLAVPILLGEPRVVWDREPGADPRAGPSVLQESRADLRSWIETEHVRFVLTTTPEGRVRAQAVATTVFLAGRYTVLRVDHEQREARARRGDPAGR